MDKQAIFDLIVTHSRQVVPALAARPIEPGDSFRHLGANSVDRSEIVMMTMESLALEIPLIETARAGNLGELADIMHRRMHGA